MTKSDHTPQQSSVDREEVKSVISHCEYLTQVDSALKKQASQEICRLTGYYNRFQNHVGVVTCDPESTIDLPFQHDLEDRT